MKRTLTKYERNLPAGTSLVIGIVLIALVIWLWFKNQKQQIGSEYKNLEEWSITYDKDGLPTKIAIHRTATRGRG